MNKHSREIRLDFSYSRREKRKLLKRVVFIAKFPLTSSLRFFLLEGEVKKVFVNKKCLLIFKYPT